MTRQPLPATSFARPRGSKKLFRASEGGRGAKPPRREGEAPGASRRISAAGAMSWRRRVNTLLQHTHAVNLCVYTASVCPKGCEFISLTIAQRQWEVNPPGAAHGDVIRLHLPITPPRPTHCQRHGVDAGRLVHVGGALQRARHPVAEVP